MVEPAEEVRPSTRVLVTIEERVRDPVSEQGRDDRRSEQRGPAQSPVRHVSSISASAGTVPRAISVPGD